MAKVKTKAKAKRMTAVLPEIELTCLSRQYLQSLSVHNASDETIRDYRYRLKTFLLWCVERDISRVADITSEVLEWYQLYLARATNRKNNNGERLSKETRNCYLSAVCKWLHWLFRENLVLSDAARQGRQRPHGATWRHSDHLDRTLSARCTSAGERRARNHPVPE